VCNKLAEERLDALEAEVEERTGLQVWEEYCNTGRQQLYMPTE